MSVVQRLFSLLLAVLITLPVTVTMPARAAVPAAPSAGCNDGLSGDGFYDSARGAQVLNFGVQEKILGDSGVNLAGTWFMSPATANATQAEQVMSAIWKNEPNLEYRFVPAAALKSGERALYDELGDCIDIDDNGRIAQAVARNAGGQGAHSEDYLLRFKASLKFADAALKTGKYSPAQIAAAWKAFAAKFGTSLSDERAALRDGFTLLGVAVDGTKLDPSTATERQTCGSKSGKGCTAGAPDAGHSVDFDSNQSRSAASVRVLTYRWRALAHRILSDEGGKATENEVKLFQAMASDARQRAFKQVKTPELNRAKQVALRGLRITYVTTVTDLAKAGDDAAAKEVYDAGKQFYPGGKDQPTYQKLTQSAKKAQEQAKKAGQEVGPAFQTQVACPPTALGRGDRPVRAALGALPARPCGPEADAKKSGATGLQKSIAAAAAGQNGGIDFSSLDLRYMADKPAGGDSSSIRYAFSGKPTSGDPHVAQGAADVKQASDAFFVWLALPESAFWVNLNPDEPDRIMDPAMGRTDAGRVMLQSDLGLKNADGKWLDPRRPVGKRFWDGLQGRCFSFRLWIVPGRADVYDGGDELYIEKAPLKVMMEAQYFKAKGISNLQGCARQDPAADDHNEALYRRLILPKVEKMVNTSPKYAELRRVYRSRIAAEWYRRRSTQHATAYKPIIDSGDVSKWRYQGSWTPQQTFEKYKGELGKHKVTLKSQRGNYIYKTTYTFGGVDWTHLPYTSQARAAFQRTNPALGARVARSLNGPVGDGGDLLLGGSVPVAHAGAAPPLSSTFLVALVALLATPVVLVAGGITLGVLLTRRRRRPRLSGGVR